MSDLPQDYAAAMARRVALWSERERQKVALAEAAKQNAIDAANRYVAEMSDAIGAWFFRSDDQP